MRIILVTSEILGAVKNGGIATATSHLSVLLAKNGHDVTLFYAGQQPIDYMDRWSLFYNLAGVNVVFFPGTSASIIPDFVKQPTEIFEQLRHLPADVVLFQDWLALGHGCIIAKRCGIAFQQTVLALITHGSTSWVIEANRAFPANKHVLDISYMEQRAIELADAVVSPSAHMISWMSNAGWKLPEDNSVIPYYLDSLELLGVELPPLSRRRTVSRPSHLVFFGRLEARKGIGIFLSALALKDLASLDFKVTFLGNPLNTADKVRKQLEESRPDLAGKIEFKSNLTSDEAQAFLAGTDCIPVIPSLIDNSPCVIYESLKLGLPFIASNSGGTPELIHPDDRDRCLFAPTAESLAAKLNQVLTSEYWAASMPSYVSSEVAASWLDWFELLPAKTARRLQVSIAARAASKSVVSGHAADIHSREITVVITHYERPDLLKQALQALSRQSDPHFEVILVDDGSKSETTLELLSTLESGFEGLSLRVIRQSNKYLGAARNEALRHVQSQYVIFLDDDDIPFPNMVETYKQAALCSSADIVTCQMQLFHNPRGEPGLDNLESGPRLAFPGGPLASASMWNCYGGVTGIYKKSVFDDVGGFHEIHGVGFEDWQLFVRAAAAGKTILCLPLPLFWYRVAPNSMTHNNDLYRNMGMIAATFKAMMPKQLHVLMDLLVGLHSAP